MIRRHKAFTLAEMLVVIGIIVLFLAMAVPTVRALTGSSSISVARNELTSLVTRAREEAVGIQDIRGVLFIADPASDRIVGVICQAATIQDSSFPNVVMLDVVLGRDSLTLPPGVRLQTMFNGLKPSGSVAGSDDRYLGFNPLVTGSPNVGGCILFDGNGKLIVKQYGFQMAQPKSPTGVTPPTTLCSMLLGMYPGSGLTSASGSVKNTTTGSSAFIAGGSTTTIPYSQIGLVLFDYDAFRTQGFGDLDADMNGSASYTGTPPTGQTQSEQTEENWIDRNSTPVLVNRYNGTLIRGE